METTASSLNAFFSEIKKTIFFLGEKKFYLKLIELNGVEMSTDEIDCQILAQQIFLFFSKYGYPDCCIRLIEIRNNSTKIPEEKYNHLLNFISLKFDILKESILHGRTHNEKIKNARELLFFLLKTHYDIPVKQIVKTHYFAHSQIDRYIKNHSELSPKIFDHSKLLEIRNETIQYLKNI